MVNFVPLLKKVIGVNINPPKWTFSQDYISALRGAAPLNFYTPYNPLNCIFSRIWGAGRPQVGLCLVFLVLHELLCSASTTACAITATASGLSC